MSKPTNWTEIGTLMAGDHVHLDCCISNPPPPGSEAWLDIIEELVTQLLRWKGAWTVSIPVGSMRQVPTTPPAIPALFRLVDAENLVEPPAVYRLNNALDVSLWEGELHRWQQLLQPAVMEVISISRSRQEAAAGEDFTATVLFEIRSPG